MKNSFLILIFSLTISLIHSQEISLATEFSWSKIENKNPALIKQFIELTPEEFPHYKLNEPYMPTIRDLFNSLHVVDINGDGLDDIIFDGSNGSEAKEIAIFLNKGNSFKRIFTDYQGILRLEFENGVLNKIRIKDWGCCAAYVTTTKFYNVEYANGEFKFTQKMSFSYVDKTILPKAYWRNTKEVRILNDNYNLRFSPELDDKSEVYFEGTPTRGNTIGKVAINARAIALAESTDLTGRVWFFVAVYPEDKVKSTHFYYNPDEIKSYKCGWVSSRFVEIVE